MSESAFDKAEPAWYQIESKENRLFELWKKYDFLFFVPFALAIDLLAPYLIWKHYVPSATRWVADVCIALLLVITVVRMLVRDNIPKGLLLILSATMLWAMVATFEGQSPIATFWGWWRMFKYPTLAVFIALQARWPENFSQLFLKIIVGVFTFEVAFQIIQFVGGQEAGDHLSGTFGRNGVGPLFFFIAFVLCLALGTWLANGQSKLLIWVVVLGSISSGLGEMKVFPVALISLGVIALSIHMIRGGRLRELFLYIILFSIIAPAFVTFYNIVVAEARGTRRFEEYFELDTTETYLNNVNYNTTTGQTYLGRGFALSYGWDVIHRDMTTLLFGFGLGARGESVSLGIVGTGLANGDYGLTTGTSLLVLMQEFGVVGLGSLVLVMFWLVVTLFQHVKQAPDDVYNYARYAVILYSLMWPFWLYYHKVWDFNVTMLIYWGAVGFLLSHPPKVEDMTDGGSFGN